MRIVMMEVKRFGGGQSSWEKGAGHWIFRAKLCMIVKEILFLIIQLNRHGSEEVFLQKDSFLFLFLFMQGRLIFRNVKKVYKNKELIKVNGGLALFMMYY